jgi:hypothetical protein
MRTTSSFWTKIGLLTDGFQRGASDLESKCIKVPFRPLLGRLLYKGVDIGSAYLQRCLPE